MFVLFEFMINAIYCANHHTTESCPLGTEEQM